MFEAAFQKALNFLSERRFNRECSTRAKVFCKTTIPWSRFIAALPTGFGKSLIFQLLALVNDDHVVLVICPLKSIVNDQIKEASSMGISAGSLSDYLQTDIVSGKYRLLFAFPEEALAKSFLEALKREGNSLRDNLAAIVETWTGKR